MDGKRTVLVLEPSLRRRSEDLSSAGDPVLTRFQSISELRLRLWAERGGKKQKKAIGGEEGRSLM